MKVGSKGLGDGLGGKEIKRSESRFHHDAQRVSFVRERDMGKWKTIMFVALSVHTSLPSLQLREEKPRFCFQAVAFPSN